MPPKRGTKRKNARASNGSVESADAESPLAPPDKESWRGWVEMESEPAFFNVMLKEMGVPGLKVQEIFSLDDGDLFLLPQPVHALIFLFKYKSEDGDNTGGHCPAHVWFANQIPDFACGTVALLNIVNNIPGLDMGQELREFKHFTKDMNPLLRGETLDDFEFVRKIHNSFAREADLLNADTISKEKVAKSKRKQSQAKAKETREAKKLKQTPLAEKSSNITATPTRSSGRAPSARKQNIITPLVGPESTKTLSDASDSDANFKTPSKIRGADDKAYENLVPSARRSARPAKPRQSTGYSSATATEEWDDGGGFHFIAYLPIEGHVWKMDGMDSFPQDVGTLNTESGDNWMSVAEPLLRTRMALHEADGIEFNLMAVVHDPLATHRAELAQNVRTLQEIDAKLDLLDDDWRSLNGAETKKEVVVGCSEEFDLSQIAIDRAEISASIREKVEEKVDDLMGLLQLRRDLINQQSPLRGAVRDSMSVAKVDEEEARHRRHDYGSFVKSWLGELADNELLGDLVADD